MVDELFDRLRLLEQDHEPDGWPAVQMRDITALLNEADAARSQIADLCAVNQALEAEVEALRQDAARYRWLREHADVTFDEPVWIMTDGGRRIHVSTFARHETDRAIDAALRAKEERNA